MKKEAGWDRTTRHEGLGLNDSSLKSRLAAQPKFREVFLTPSLKYLINISSSQNVKKRCPSHIPALVLLSRVVLGSSVLSSPDTANTETKKNESS